MLVLLMLSACSPEPETDSARTCEDIVQAAVNSPACGTEREALQERLRREQPAPYQGQQGKMPQYKW
jgi:hypothetical protein